MHKLTLRDVEAIQAHIESQAVEADKRAAEEEMHAEHARKLKAMGLG